MKPLRPAHFIPLQPVHRFRYLHITHTSPSFCELSSHHFLEDWAEHDVDLMDDIKYERQVMDDLYNYLYTKNHPLRYWYYGHFHESWHAQIDDIMFHMLDIMELREIPPKDLS